MYSRLARTLVLAFLLTVFTGILRADVPVAPNILDPKSPPEAWNIIRLATSNVSRLLEENRLPEIPTQISFCSPSLRLLARAASSPEAATQVDDLTKRAFVSINAIALGAQQGNDIGVKQALDSLRATLESITTHFDPKIVNAEIYWCPLHPELISESQGTKCSRCGRSLIPRRIPYSFVYMKPGSPTVRITASISGPVEAGKPVEVKVQLAKQDKSPLLYSDVIETHGQPIHLLIEEPGLSDYHHVLPAPTATPGEYSFTFTPKKTAPYRIWADIVPSATSIQELPFVDLQSGNAAEPAKDTENQFVASVDGYQFTLTASGGTHLPFKAEQVRKMTLQVTKSDGKPVTTLEPIMNAFAHLVGFYGDHETIVHLHPTGGDILNPEARGGPSLGFLFFPPKPGFVRLYCEVKLDGKTLLVPFSVNVQP